MDPIKNPFEIPSQPSELPSVEVPRSIETEKPVSQAQVQAKIESNDAPLAAETEALELDHPDIEGAIAIPAIEERNPQGDTLSVSENEDKILGKLNGVK